MAALLSQDTLLHACAGCAGSVAAATITLPLTNTFTRAQLDQDKPAGAVSTLTRLAREEGLSSLFRGGQATLLSVAASNFVYFYSFHGLKAAGPGEAGAGRDLLFSLLAGCCNVLTTNPLWVVSTRLRTRQPGQPSYRGLGDGLAKIALQEGVAALWNGTRASLLLVSNPAIKFTLYELLKRRWVAGGRRELGGTPAFLLGCLATLLATLATYPLQLVQARARHGAAAPMLEIARQGLNHRKFVLLRFYPVFIGRKHIFLI